MLKNALNEALRDIAALKNADDQTVLATRWVWNLRQDADGVHSTENMTDEELAQAFIEDLLTIHDFNRQGRSLSVTLQEMARFLSQDERSRLADVLADPPVFGFFEVGIINGAVTLCEESIEDAMDYAGVWLEGYTPPEDEVVYTAGRLPS